MLRLTGTILTLLALGVSRDTPRAFSPTQENVRELLTAARGAPAALCELAARSVGNYGGRWNDAPVTPLPRTHERATERESRNGFAADDVRLLLDNLATADPCVRELAVRLLGTDETRVGGSQLRR